MRRAKRRKREDFRLQGEEWISRKGGKQESMENIPPIVGFATGVGGYPLSLNGLTPPKTPSQTITSYACAPVGEAPKNVS